MLNKLIITLLKKIINTLKKCNKIEKKKIIQLNYKNY